MVSESVVNKTETLSFKPEIVRCSGLSFIVRLGNRAKRCLAKAYSLGELYLSKDIVSNDNDISGEQIVTIQQSTMNAVRRSISVAPGWSRRRLLGDQSVLPPLFPIFCQPIGLVKNWEKEKRNLSYPPALPGAIDMQALMGLCTAELLHQKQESPGVSQIARASEPQRRPARTSQGEQIKESPGVSQIARAREPQRRPTRTSQGEPH